MKQIRLAVLAAILILLASAGGALAMSSPNYQILWQAESTSGGDVTASTNYNATFTVGQTATSQSSGDGLTVSLGYWQAAETVNLPYVSK